MKTTTFNMNGLVSENFRELTADEMADVQGGSSDIFCKFGDITGESEPPQSNWKIPASPTTYLLTHP